MAASRDFGRFLNILTENPPMDQPDQTTLNQAQPAPLSLRRFGAIVMRKYPVQMVLICIMVFIAAILEIIGLAAILPVFMGLLDQNTAGQASSILGDIPSKLGIDSLSVYQSLALISIIMAARGILLFLSQYVLARISATLEQELREDLIKAFLESKWTYQLKQDDGTLINGALREANISASAILQFGHLLSGTMIALCLLFTSIALSIPAFIIFSLSTIPYFALGHWINKQMRNQANKRLEASNLGTTQLSDMLGMKKYIKATDTAAQSYNRFDDISKTLTSTALATQTFKAIIFSYPEVLGIITIALLISVTHALQLITPEQMFFFLLLIYRAYSQVSKVQSARSSLMSYLPSYELVEGKIQHARAHKETFSGEKFGADQAYQLHSENKPLAHFEHFEMSYHPGQPILKKITAHIPAKGLIALVGRSGAGKTSMADALCGILPPAGGQLSYGDIPADQINMQSLRRGIAYVPQETALIAGTIGENILFGADDRSEENLKRAIEHAELKSFIENLPDGLNTQVGDRGQKLSGGQRQRVAIARALARNPFLLILDEATSALDNETESYINQVIDDLKHELCIILIAHRFTTIKNADMVYVLDHGEIVEQGTYDELKNKKGLFEQLQSYELA